MIAEGGTDILILISNLKSVINNHDNYGNKYKSVHACKNIKGS